MKFLATVDCLDVKTKTSKLLGKTLLDLRCRTSFQDGRHIKLTWPMFDIILFSTRSREGILPSRNEVYVTVSYLDIHKKLPRYYIKSYYTRKFTICFKMAAIIDHHGRCFRLHPLFNPRKRWNSKIKR